MIRTDEDALVCDLAEVYHIYDYRALRPSYAAALACGLREDSRIKRALSGSALTLTEMLLAGILDNLKLLVWAQTKDAQHGKNKPKSVLDILTKKQSAGGYASPEAFEAARRALLNGGE